MHKYKYILAISTFFLSVSAFGMAGIASSTFIVNVGDATNAEASAQATDRAGDLSGDSIALDLARQACQTTQGSAQVNAADHTNGDHTNGDKHINGDKHLNGDKHINGDVLCASETNSLDILSGHGRPGDYVCQCM